jgi:hypothetical protein
MQQFYDMWAETEDRLVTYITCFARQMLPRCFSRQMQRYTHDAKDDIDYNYLCVNYSLYYCVRWPVAGYYPLPVIQAILRGDEVMSLYDSCRST